MSNNLTEEMHDWFTYCTDHTSYLCLDVTNQSYTAETIKIRTSETRLRYDCTKCNSFTIVDSNIDSCEFFPISGLQTSSVNIRIHNCNKIDKFNFKNPDIYATGSNRNFFIYDDSNITMKKFFGYRPEINRLELRDCTNAELYDIDKWVDANINTHLLFIVPHRRLINLSMILHESITKNIGTFGLLLYASDAYNESEIDIFNNTFEKYSKIDDYTKCIEYSMDFILALGSDFENDI